MTTARQTATPDAIWNGRMKPTFLIIGAQRCGTTSLFRYLEQHPDFAKPRTKEVHFFTRYYSNGPAWYASQFPRLGGRIPGLHALRSRGDITAEATPAYLYGERVPARCAELLPDVKLIALLRDPIERAYSHYRHSVREGYESLPFADAIRSESERIEGEKQRERADEDFVSDPLRWYSYLDRGLYGEQIDRWLKHYPRERLLLLRSEDLFSDPGETFSRLLRFVGMREWAPKRFEVHNSTKKAPKIEADLLAEMRSTFEASNMRLARDYGAEFRWDD